MPGVAGRGDNDRFRTGYKTSECDRTGCILQSILSCGRRPAAPRGPGVQFAEFGHDGLGPNKVVFPERALGSYSPCIKFKGQMRLAVICSGDSGRLVQVILHPGRHIPILQGW